MKYFIIGCISKWSPFVRIKKLGNGTFEFSGSVWNVFTSVMAYLNTPYVLIGPTDGRWGLKDKHGNYDGMLGKIQRKEVDFALGPFVVTHDRYSDFDFTTPIHVSELIILAKKPTEKNRLDGFLTPFTLTVWLYLLISILTVGAFYFTLSAIRSRIIEHSSKETTCNTHVKNLLCHMWISLKTFLQQSLKTPPKELSNQVMFGFWSLATLVVYMMYGSILLTHITLPESVKKMETLEELANHPIIRPGVAKGGSNEQWFKFSKKKTEMMIWKRAVLIKNCASSYSQIMNDNLAVICQEEDADATIAKDFAKTGKCNLYAANNQILSYSLALAFPMNSPLISKVNKRIQDQISTGLMMKWRDQASLNASYCRYSSTGSVADSEKAFTIEDIQGIFYVWFAGIGTSTLIIFAEIIHFKFSKK